MISINHICFAVFAMLFFLCSPSAKAQNDTYRIAKEKGARQSPVPVHNRLKTALVPHTAYISALTDADLTGNKEGKTGQATAKRNTYYLSNRGNDNHKGDKKIRGEQSGN